MMRSFSLAFSALACSALLVLMLDTTGCASHSGRPVSELEQTAGNKKQSYRVRRGDALMIEIWGEPRLTGERVVRDDGRLTLPLINDVDAEGKTLEALSNDISQKLSTFIAAPSVSISVSRTAPIRYYLSGSFLQPGEKLSATRITVLQALATGGGFAPFADQSAITLIRKAPDGDRRYNLSYSRIVDGRDPNPELEDGDVLNVP